MLQQPRSHGLALQRGLRGMLLQERRAEQLPRQRRRARTGRGIEHVHSDLHAHTGAAQHRVDPQRIRLPACQPLAAQRRAAPQQRQAQRYPRRAGGAIGMAVHHRAQQLRQERRRQRLLRVVVQQPVQPRHVDALDLHRRQIDVQRRLRRQGVTGGRIAQADRQGDAVHADPLQRRGDRGRFAARHVGQRRLHGQVHWMGKHQWRGTQRLRHAPETPGSNRRCQVAATAPVLPGGGR